MLKEFENLNAFMRYAQEINDTEPVIDDRGLMLYQSTITQVTDMCRVFDMHTEDSCITIAFNNNTNKLCDIIERMCV